mgnify:CR=1 FL=1
MTPDDLFQRMKRYALRIIQLVATFPRGPTGETVGRPLVKSGTSVPANYRSACISPSRAAFIHKLGIVAEEADESLFWIDFAADAGLTRRTLVADLIEEGQEILRIVISSRKTANSRK